MEFEIPTPQPLSTSSSSSTSTGSDWILCWHGRSAHEFLVSYPVHLLTNGLVLTDQLVHPWDTNTVEDLANDSLKTCLFEGRWYGNDAQRGQYFPRVSFMILENNRIEVCEHANCADGQQWILEPANSPPSAIRDLIVEPTSNTLSIVGFIETSRISP